MSYTSRVTYSATAGQSEFDFPYPYLSRDHVHALVGGVSEPFTWVTATRIALETPAASGDIVTVKRITPVHTAITSFGNGNVLTGEDLNIALAQALYREEELADDIIDGVGSGGGGGGPSGPYVSSINGFTGDVTITAAGLGAANVFHSHTIDDVTGLQTALDAKAALASPTFTGTPAAPTASLGDNSLRIATTAFVKNAIDAAVIGGGGGGPQEPPLLSDYGPVDTGGVSTTDNSATFTAAEADTNKSAVYIPEGLYATSLPRTSLTKAYTGRGVILTGTEALPAKFSYMAVKPSTWPVQGALGWFRGDQRFTDGGEWKIIGPLVRTYDLTARYFESNTIPHHMFFDSQSGNSGANAFLTSGINPGMGTTIPLAAAADAEWIGKTVALSNGMDGAQLETRTVTGVSGNNVIVNSAFSTTMSWNPTGGFAPVLYFGKRTSANPYYIKHTHTGGGDAYQMILRQNVNYVPKATEKHTFQTATGGNIGGDTYANANGVYLQNQEWQLQGQNYDVAAVGYVSSLARNVDYALDGGKVWLGTYFKSDGARPADVAHAVAGFFRNVIDSAYATTFETSRLTVAASAGQTSITVASTNGVHPNDTVVLGSETKTVQNFNAVAKTITFTSALVGSYPVDTYVQYPKGGAVLNMALGQRQIWNSSVSNFGRGGDANQVYAPFYGNVQGDLIMESGNDGATDFWAVRFARGTTASAPDTARIRLRPTGFQIYGTSHTVNGSVGITNGGLNINTGQLLTLGSGCYLYADGTHIYAVSPSSTRTVA